ncbi:alpha/beta hydrolase [Aquamicrobium sp. LC103]|uniref:alpha/beta fold hydrolase n=1 Tax=Aquamicrobium sp. LC103 TaxID=1120658 RepID=UPI00063E75C0|nr:alpha/beta hydrolase [Aquamicrobium sp. LC103]TKT81291.1 alpha/beta hydrolase [Aquamicrobium sp. LC103]
MRSLGGTEGEDFHYSAADGLRLHARIHGGGDRDALPVVCLPGLTRNARDFDALALHLSRNAARPRRIVCFDYRGRGKSQHDPDWRNYNVAVEAGDVLAGLAALGIRHAAFIGTSRGGLIVHVLTAMRPTILKAVVLNDIGPVVENTGLAQIRAYLSNARKPRDFAEAAAIQKEIHGEAFPALSDDDWRRMAWAIYREDEGIPVADFDPALLNTLAMLDLDKPLPALWPQFDGLRHVPILAIRGANSKLLAAGTLAEMARRHPDIETAEVEGQGHAPFLETGGLPGLIERFLDRADPEHG